MLTVDEDTTRHDLEVCMSHLCDQAKTEARRGHIGVKGQRYADLHGSIDLILAEWQERA